MTTHLDVIDGGRASAAVPCQRPSWECDELRVSRDVAATERLRAATQERQLLTRAIHALAQPVPDLAAGERFIVAAIRIAIREATRAAADIEPGPEPVAIAA